MNTAARGASVGVFAGGRQQNSAVGTACTRVTAAAAAGIDGDATWRDAALSDGRGGM